MVCFKMIVFKIKSWAAFKMSFSPGYFSFQPVLYNWCNKGCGMYHPVCGIVHLKDLILLNKVLLIG